MPALGSYPLIRHKGPSQLTLNLLGQNQTGPNVVKSEVGASVLFGALSSAAQVAVDQTSITSGGGTYDFGPQGRIQRHVVPRPPASPATASQIIDKPNVLIRCDGTVEFTQDLPGIATGFTISFGPVNSTPAVKRWLSLGGRGIETEVSPQFPATRSTGTPAKCLSASADRGPS